MANAMMKRLQEAPRKHEIGGHVDVVEEVETNCLRVQLLVEPDKSLEHTLHAVI